MERRLAIVLILGFVCLPSLGLSREKPNLIFVLSDDIATDFGETRGLAVAHPRLVAKAVQSMNDARTPHSDWPDPADLL